MNVLIAMESAEHTLNALNVKRGKQIMNEKSIPQTLREQANALEKLAQRIAREGQALPVADDREISEELADALFAFQSKLRYEYSWIAGAIWDE